MVSLEVAGETGMVKEFCVWQHIEPILAKLSSVGLASQMPSLSLSLSLFFLSFFLSEALKSEVSISRNISLHHPEIN
jgi:hypothetical protein